MRSDPQTVQVCKEFRRNSSCEFGKRCKYAHPTDNAQLIPTDVKVCQDFLGGGECSRISCKHYHPFEGQDIRAGTLFLKVCRDFFQKAECPRDPCNFAHPSNDCAMPLHVEVCVNFMIGKCAREDCKFYHDTDQRLEAIPCTDYPNCARGSSCSFSHIGARFSLTTTPTLPDVCYDFLDGKCTRGATCKYSHGGLAPAVSERDLMERAKGGSADASRECLDFFHGRCTRGAQCRYVHQVGPAPGSAPTTGVQQSLFVPLRNSTSPPKFADPTRECLDYFYGRCTRGADCKYTHVEGDAAAQAGLPASAIFARGDRGGSIVDGPLADVLLPRAPLPSLTSRGSVNTHHEDGERKHDGAFMRDRPACEDPSRQCLDYFHGKCTRGDTCRFAHDSTAMQVEQRLARGGGGGGGDRSCDRATSVTLPSAFKEGLPGGPPVGQADPKHECLDFFHGRCTRGDSCRYDHYPQANAHERRGDTHGRPLLGTNESPRHRDHLLPHGASDIKPCKDFLLGRCSRDNCKYLHDRNMACPDFKRGSCSRGRDCIMSHAEECKDFMHGKCSRGSSCRFVHDAASIIAPIRGGSRHHTSRRSTPYSR